jgi:hypothetical protein
MEGVPAQTHAPIRFLRYHSRQSVRLRVIAFGQHDILRFELQARCRSVDIGQRHPGPTARRQVPPRV